jgi:hypothetical protein
MEPQARYISDEQIIRYLEKVVEIGYAPGKPPSLNELETRAGLQFRTADARKLKALSKQVLAGANGARAEQTERPEAPWPPKAPPNRKDKVTSLVKFLGRLLHDFDEFDRWFEKAFPDSEITEETDPAKRVILEQSRKEYQFYYGGVFRKAGEIEGIPLRVTIPEELEYLNASLVILPNITALCLLSRQTAGQVAEAIRRLSVDQKEIWDRAERGWGNWGQGRAPLTPEDIECLKFIRLEIIEHQAARAAGLPYRFTINRQLAERFYGLQVGDPKLPSVQHRITALVQRHIPPRDRAYRSKFLLTQGKG